MYFLLIHKETVQSLQQELQISNKRLLDAEIKLQSQFTKQEENKEKVVNDSILNSLSQTYYLSSQHAKVFQEATEASSLVCSKPRCSDSTDTLL